MKVQEAPRPLLQQKPPSLREAPTPEEISLDYVDARESTLEEPPHLKGVVYQQSPNGTVTILKTSGQTAETLPPDIPESAVKDGRVFLYVDGIHQEMSEQNRQIRYFLHKQAATGVDVGQDVIGIHEGAGPSGFQDGIRIGKVLSMLKLVQTGLVPLEWAKKKLYKIDPAIKSVHDQVKQSLLAGRKVQLMTHSGGGAETATALTLLAKAGMREQIRDNVRLLSLASAAALEDFVGAGLKPENIYYTGSKNDPVHYLFRNYLHPLAPLSGLCFAANVVRYAVGWGTKKDPNGLSYHAPDYIFAKNMVGEQQRIARFLEGGSGGVHVLP